MKRINAETSTYFKRGDKRNDGFRFSKYTKRLKSDGFFVEIWQSPQALTQETKRQTSYHNSAMSTKQGRIRVILKNAKQRADKAGIPFDLTTEYLESIAPEKCPVFGFDLGWCSLENKSPKPNSPSLDRIKPELGYVKNNVQWLSHLANSMKSNATSKELHQFANWIKSTIL